MNNHDFKLGDLVRVKPQSIHHPNYGVSRRVGAITSVKSSTPNSSKLIYEVGIPKHPSDESGYWDGHWFGYFFADTLEHLDFWWKD